MEITRIIDGKTFTFALTNEEINRVYRKKEFDYHTEDIATKLKEYPKTARRYVRKNMGEAVRLYEKNLANDDSWNNAATMAIETMCESY